MIDEASLAIGALLLLGYWAGRGANALNLPRVSGYLVAGMVLSPSLSGCLSRRLIEEELLVVIEIALGVIAYSIGGSLVYHRLRRLGKSIVWIALSQAAGTFLLSVLLLLPVIPFLAGLRGSGFAWSDTYLPMALIIGAISVVTAPGAILAIVGEMRARGPFTTILLGIIALGDALAIIVFALADFAAQALINPGSQSWAGIVWKPAAEILLSLLLGLASGLVLMWTGRHVRRREALLMVVLGTITATGGIASALKLSGLLANMVVGFIIVNLERRHHDFFLVVEQIEEALFGLFFGLAGALVDFKVLYAAGFLTPAIILVRMAGKQLGAWLGARISDTPPHMGRYLGMCLFPKAGVTVGLVLVARELFLTPPIGDILVNAVIGSMILNELIAPPLVKHALIKVGETAMPEEAS